MALHQSLGREREAVWSLLGRRGHGEGIWRSEHCPSPINCFKDRISVFPAPHCLEALDSAGRQGHRAPRRLGGRGRDSVGRALLWLWTLWLQLCDASPSGLQAVPVKAMGRISPQLHQSPGCSLTTTLLRLHACLSPKPTLSPARRQGGSCHLPALSLSRSHEPSTLPAIIFPLFFLSGLKLGFLV